jgi:hypothetical protein
VRLACTNSRKLRAKKRGADCVYSIKDINENCLAEFRTHWQCLENHNQQLWNCRSEERRLNKCVFEKLVCCDWACLHVCVLTCVEPGEEDTRHTEGRDTSSSTDSQHLCDTLSFVYIPVGQQNRRQQLQGGYSQLRPQLFVCKA